MRLFWFMTVLVALSACVEGEERSVTLNRYKLICKNDYGFVYDSPEMAECIMALEQRQIDADRAFRASMSQAMRDFNAGMRPVPVIPYTPAPSPWSY
jgi:hypothetical protein